MILTFPGRVSHVSHCLPSAAWGGRARGPRAGTELKEQRLGAGLGDLARKTGIRIRLAAGQVRAGGAGQVSQGDLHQAAESSDYLALPLQPLELNIPKIPR